MATTGGSGGGRWPSLVVFDLDDCVWSPEMYTLNQIPSAAGAVRGSLGNDKGEGVVGVRSGSEVIRLFPGALQAFQRVLAGEYGAEMRLAAASSADTPQAVRIGRAGDCPAPRRANLIPIKALPCRPGQGAGHRAGAGVAGPVQPGTQARGRRHDRNGPDRNRGGSGGRAAALCRIVRRRAAMPFGTLSLAVGKRLTGAQAAGASGAAAFGQEDRAC